MRAWRKSRSIQTRLFVTRKYSKNLSQKRKNGQASEDLTHIVISVSFCDIQASGAIIVRRAPELDFHFCPKEGRLPRRTDEKPC